MNYSAQYWAVVELLSSKQNCLKISGIIADLGSTGMGWSQQKGSYTIVLAGFWFMECSLGKGSMARLPNTSKPMPSYQPIGVIAWYELVLPRQFAAWQR